MNNNRDIQDIGDIKTFVNAFYQKVRLDPVLAPEFLSRIPGDWQPHLDKMYLFWNAALFGEKGYIGNPFARHAGMAINAIHFERWLSLFSETVDQHFSGPVAEDAKWRAATMAHNFLRRLNENRENNTITLV